MYEAAQHINISSNGNTKRRLVQTQGRHVVAFGGVSNFGSGTLEVNLHDRGTGVKLATDPDKYVISAAVEPFEILLAAGMDLSFSLTGSSGANIDIFVYPIGA